jgi:hypothetical protein
LSLNAIIGGITKNLTVDSTFNVNLMLNLINDFRSINANTIPSLTLPNYGYTTSSGAEVLGLQQPQAQQTIAAFKAFGTGPAATPSPSTTTTSTTTSTTVPVSTSITAPPVTVKPSSQEVQVANGTGNAGQAAKMSQFLAGLGYNTQVSRSSPGYDYSETEILYAPDALTTAQQLAATIPGGARLSEDPALAPTIYNVEVITGTSYSTGVYSSAPPATTTTTVPPTTTTTVPGTNSSTYVLPGTQAGQVQPANC